MVADLALAIRLPECRVPFGESRQRLRVLSAQRGVDRLPRRYDGVEERIALPQRGLHVEGRHRLVERAAYDTLLPIQDGDGLRQGLLVDLDGIRRTGGIRQGRSEERRVGKECRSRWS